MREPNANPDLGLESLDHLPGYFRAEIERTGAPDQHPVGCLLEGFEREMHRVERIIADSRMLADPFGIADAFPEERDLGWQRKHLGWLASWLDLELDPDWLANPGNGEDSPYGKAREVIARIASLQGLRGTPGGLKKMIKLFHDLDVEILEHAWVRGMEIDLASIIGVDTLITEEPDADLDFVVLVKAGQDRIRFREGRVPCEIRNLNGKIAGQLLYPMDDLQPEGGMEPGADRAARQEPLLAKLQTLIDREKPAHTRCLVVLESGPVPEPATVKIPPLVIEVTSEIGNFLIDKAT